MSRLSGLKRVDPRTIESIFKAAVFEQLMRPIHFRSCWSAKIDFYIHQIETALRVLGMDPPRVILADEVGLGKTIETLLILKELISKGEAERTLVIVPSSLTNQWRYEMETKFDLFPKLLTRHNLNRELEDDNRGLHLVSIDYAKRHVGSLSKFDWDMIIFDEAHHLRRHKRPGGRVDTTLKYRLAKELSFRTNGLLLLTATPMQLDEFEFYSILGLLHEDLFETYDSFQYYYDVLLPRIVDGIRRIEKKERIDIPKMHLLHSRGRQCIGHFDLQKLRNDCTDPLEIKRALQTLVVFPQIMIRNRKREEFPHMPPREISTVPVSYTSKEHSLYSDLTGFFRRVYGVSSELGSQSLRFLTIVYQQMLASSPAALARSFKRRLGNLTSPEIVKSGTDLNDNDKERRISRLLPGESAETEVTMLKDFLVRLEELAIDSKLNSLISIVENLFQKHPGEKVIIFTRFLETQAYLAETLGRNFEVVTFNGKMNNQEKDGNVRRFRESAEIMISSEAGGEGRNFQFCHIMINYDLPWNPVRLEQRIGRIDRIGQVRRVVVYNLVIDSTVEERIYEVLVDRLYRFQNLIGAADTVLGNIEVDIAKVILAQDDVLQEEEYDRFTTILEAKIEKAKKAAMHFDRLSSLRKKGVERSMASKEVRREFPTQDLENFTISFIGGIDGASIRRGDMGHYSISVPKHSKLSNRFSISMKATFDREEAVREGDIEYLNPDHTFIRNILAVILSNQEPVISFEENVNIDPEAQWCFYGGEEKGYCFVSTQKGTYERIYPEEIRHSTFYDEDVRSEPDVTVVRSMSKYYEKARLIAEKEMDYPEGGVDLACVRVVNFRGLQGLD